MNIINKFSPNISTGRKTYKPEAIVIHIMEGTLPGTDNWFANPQSKVSAHYGIGKNGEVHRYVEEKDTAWHAGRVYAPSWNLIKRSANGLFVNPNYYTIGIEHEGNENSPWPDQMYQSSGSLISEISLRWGIPVDRSHILGHHEIYSEKTCPGFKVDLNKLISIATGIGQLPAAALPPRKIVLPGNATTKTGLRIRPQPNRALPQVGFIEKGTQIAYEGYTEDGENIDGNSTWYFTNDGKWFWKGGLH
jgi:N-acetyl-anhydromuramyl-L-alanine amidase AmpD